MSEKNIKITYKNFRFIYIEEWDLTKQRFVGRLSMCRSSGRVSHVMIELNDNDQFVAAKKKLYRLWLRDNKTPG